MPPQNSDFLTYQEGVTLREYLETKILASEGLTLSKLTATEALLISRLEAMDKAITLALQNQSQRFDTTNEWRKTVDDILKTAVLVSTYAPEVLRIRSDINELKATSSARTRDLSKIESMEASIEDLKLSRASLAGKAEQSSVYWVGALSLIGVLVSVLSFVQH